MTEDIPWSATIMPWCDDWATALDIAFGSKIGDIQVTTSVGEVKLRNIIVFDRLQWDNDTETSEHNAFAISSYGLNALQGKPSLDSKMLILDPWRRLRPDVWTPKEYKVLYRIEFTRFGVKPPPKDPNQ